MLTTLFVVLVTHLLTKVNFEVTLQLSGAFKLLVVLIVCVTILFWIVHHTLSYDKDSSRYEDLWDEPWIHVFGAIYTVVELILLFVMISNKQNNLPVFSGTAINVVAVIALDIASVAVMFVNYSYDLKESVIDSLLYQIQRVRNALILLLLLIIIQKFTIVGVIIIIILFGLLIDIINFFFKRN